MDPDPDYNLEEDTIKKVAGTAAFEPGLSWTEEYDNDDFTDNNDNDTDGGRRANAHENDVYKTPTTRTDRSKK